MEYTLGLALEDYVPVILSIAGLYFISQMINRIDSDSGRLARIALVLIGTGGLLKASWKLIIATTGNDVVWMDNSLFVLLGPGFTLMAFALWGAIRKNDGQPVKSNLAIPPIIIIVLFGALAVFMSTRGGRTWVFILLGLTTISNTAVLIMLIRQSWRKAFQLGAVLFGVNLLLIFMLSGMARIDPQTIPLQWGEQITNTFSQSAFVYAAWRLSQRMMAGAKGESEPQFSIAEGA